MKRGKMILGFWLRAVTFTVILACVLTWSVYVLTPKDAYGICPITNYYNLPEDTVDVLVVGTSLGYAGVNTNVLWTEYGIAAYNLCGAEQPYWITYHWLQEALRTQRPKLIILDAKAATYTLEYSKRGRTILSTYGIRDFETRMSAIAACVKEEDFWGFALGWPQIHSNYPKVNEDSFRYPPDNDGRGPNWKGYIEADLTEQHEKPSLVWNTTKKPMVARQEEWLIKTLDLIEESGIPCLIVAFPNPDYANDHMYYNSLWHIAEDYPFRTVNYNDPNLRLRLAYSSDFADWQHLNVKGSVKFTRRLGEDLKAKYDLPDRRGDERFVSYDLCAQDWYAKYPDHIPEPKED